MTKSFNCASCSAPLEFEGKTIQKCRFCGSTVIAPPEMFYAVSAAPFGDFSSLTGKALKTAEIDQLIHNGRKIEAIKLFRETFGTGLKEAKDAVEAMERGESVDISGMQVSTSRRAVSPQNAEAVKKISYTIGGTVVGIILLSLLIIVGVTAAVLYFTFTAFDKSLPQASNVSARPTAAPSATKAPDTTELLRIGGEGNGAGRFKDNRHVAVDGQGRIYSSDYSPLRIQVFDASGKFINQWAAESGINLYDLAADRQGNLYIANEKGLFKYEGETGKLLAKAERIYPRGMTLTWDGKVAVAAGKTIAFFDKDLRPGVEITDAAERANSTFGFEKIAADGAGLLYAIDRHDGDIRKFTSDGKFVDRFSSSSRSANAIAVDPAGRLFVSDTSNVYVLDAEGNLLKSFETRQAFGLTFDQDGHIYIAARPYVLKHTLNF